MLRKRVIGSHKKQISTVVNWVATDQQGEAKQMINMLAKEPEFPIERYGARPAVHITDYEAAKQWIDKLGFDSEWL
jgi:hypothetical protein